MAVSYSVMAQSLYTPTTRKIDDNLYSLYKKAMKTPLEKNVMKIIQVLVYGKRRSGKSWTEAKIVTDFWRARGKKAIPGKNTFVSNDFNALFDQIGKSREIALVLDDPLKKYLSRGGSTKHKKEAIGNFMEIAHESEKKLESLGKSDSRSGVILIIFGPQDITLFDRAFRSANIKIFKSVAGEEEAMLKELGGKYKYINQLRTIQKKVELDYKRYYQNYNVCSMYGETGYLILPITNKKGEIIDKDFIDICDVNSDFWVHRKEKSDDEWGLKIQQERIQAKNEFFMDPTINPTPNGKIVKNTIWSLVDAFLTEKLGKTPQWMKYNQKSVYNMILAELYKLESSSGPEEMEEPVMAYTDDLLYKGVLWSVDNDKKYWKNKDRQKLAVMVLREYMGYWKEGTYPSQSDIAHELKSKYKDFKGKKFTQVMIGDILVKQKVQTRETLGNFLNGVHGGNIFEAIYSKLRENENPDNDIIKEIGNRHQPDLVEKAPLENKANISTLKFQFTTKLTSRQMSQKYVFDDYVGQDGKTHRGECRPEVDASRLGYCVVKDESGKERKIEVNPYFDFVYFNPTWGCHVIVVPKIDPVKYKSITVKFPDKYELHTF